MYERTHGTPEEVGDAMRARPLRWSPEPYSAGPIPRGGADEMDAAAAAYDAKVLAMAEGDMKLAGAVARVGQFREVPHQRIARNERWT